MSEETLCAWHSFQAKVEELKDEMSRQLKPSRALSCSVTKLDEALLWYREALEHAEAFEEPSK